MSSPLERTLAIRQRFQSLAGWLAREPSSAIAPPKEADTRTILNQPDTPPRTEVPG
ncbi:hypothetical protein G7B40_026870 [Aetokthonos hydrillicola Thurmond2011]|uniref:Uncharacterized protein n=1 Tax=Aetokthonos hydrillicola Thurmond2011 TaxID=2712845 RepID=A0AAP5MCC5_9CYAN|nr:hypothetical protein [Aetokthonos hydrillicola]MBO3461609.1 hypothetical protein [Aetokthonos hydrillicola CCALA 1050]MBW4589308.1 hypothetical protein [Aetokthonos hydrillicola CCALA 1050]MDR9898158.1 hypothetical protein [Aetokthonos hydrillicola Thurmond2011]